MLWIAAGVTVSTFAEQDAATRARPPAVTRPDWTPMLPQSPGRDYAIGLCGSCHSVARLALQKRSVVAWRTFLVNLNTTATTSGELCACVGGPLDDQEIETLTAYLSKWFGPANPIDQLPLNVNTASAAALMRLPGLTPADVRALLDARAHRPYVARSQIRQLLGEAKFQAIGTFIDVKDSLFWVETPFVDAGEDGHVD